MWTGAATHYGPQVHPGWSDMRTKMTLAGLAALALLAVACGSGDKDTAGPGSGGGNGKSGGKAVVLEVTGPKSADVTYGLGTDQSQEQGVALPWKKEMTSNESMLIVTLLAQNKGTGDISCKITIDGKTVKENKSSGQYATVTCSANGM